MNLELSNNNVFLQGVVEDKPTLNHSVLGEDFYSFNLRVKRLSGNDDILPIIISQKLMDDIEPQKMVALRGQFRSFNKQIDGKSKLILSIFCREICPVEEDTNTNSIELNGYICKSPIYRSTPLSREICDLLIAVNRNYNKSDYIPCIAWGRNAQFINSAPVGTKVHLTGRIQSRVYNKKIDGTNETLSKTAYEVSISNLAIIENKTL